MTIEVDLVRGQEEPLQDLGPEMQQIHMQLQALSMQLNLTGRNCHYFAIAGLPGDFPKSAAAGLTKAAMVFGPMSNPYLLAHMMMMELDRCGVQPMVLQAIAATLNAALAGAEASLRTAKEEGPAQQSTEEMLANLRESTQTTNDPNIH